MKLHDDKLFIHRVVIPRMKPLADAQTDSSCSYEEQFEDLLHAKIFDCRNLPIDFLIDTGKAEQAELEALKHEVRLPFNVCYFEFAGSMGVLATESDLFGAVDLDEGEKVGFEAGDEWQPPHLGVTIDIFAYGTYPTGGPIRDGFGHFANFIDEVWDVKENQMMPLPFFGNVNIEDEDTETEEGIKIGAELLLGVLALLKDRLLLTEMRPDPAPQLSRARQKAGKLPVTSKSAVLTLNVGAVREATKRTRPMMHEPPCLHWRRGHWRTRFRGLMRDKPIWVRRCLVGDPDRGYKESAYRIVRTLEADELPEVSTVPA